MRKLFKEGDSVVKKDKPSPNEMIITRVTPHHNQVPSASADNPVYHCRYWDKENNRFKEAPFLGNELKKC